MTPHFIVVGNLGREPANDAVFGAPQKESPAAHGALAGRSGIAAARNQSMPDDQSGAASVFHMSGRNPGNLSDGVVRLLNERGFRVAPSAAGGWLVSSMGTARYCRAPADLCSFARRIGIDPDDSKRLTTARALAALQGVRLETEVAIDGRVRFRLECADGRVHLANHLAEVEMLLEAAPALLYPGARRSA